MLNPRFYHSIQSKSGEAFLLIGLAQTLTMHFNLAVCEALAFTQIVNIGMIIEEGTERLQPFHMYWYLNKIYRSN